MLGILAILFSFIAVISNGNGLEDVTSLTVLQISAATWFSFVALILVIIILTIVFVDIKFSKK